VVFYLAEYCIGLWLQSSILGTKHWGDECLHFFHLLWWKKDISPKTYRVFAGDKICNCDEVYITNFYIWWLCLIFFLVGVLLRGYNRFRLGSLNSSNVWTRQEIHLIPADTDHYGRLSVTSTQKGVFWIDQVSVMPSDTYKVSWKVHVQRDKMRFLFHAQSLVMDSRGTASGKILPQCWRI
jgi:hypothetical protein